MVIFIYCKLILILDALVLSQVPGLDETFSVNVEGESWGDKFPVSIILEDYHTFYLVFNVFEAIKLFKKLRAI